MLAATAHADGQTGSGDVGREATVRVGYPGKAWRLALDLPGHRMAPPRIAADNSLLVALGEFGDAGFVVSVTLETLPEAHSARDCIEHYRKLTRGRSAVSRASVKSLGHPVATVVRYTLEGSQDGGFHQKHFNAYLHHDGYCIDVHLSKDACLTHEEARLQDAVRSIRLEPAGEVDAVAPRPPVGARPDGATKRDAGGDSPGLRAFPIHDRPLALVLDARDVVMENSNPRYAFDIRRRRYRGQKVTGWSWWGQRLEGRVSLGVWARIDSDEEHARNWRDRIWPEIDVGLASRPEGVTRGERDGVAWVDYTRPWRQRARIDARSRHLFLAKGDVVAAAHLEIVDPRPEDDVVFEEFLAAARFETREPQVLPKSQVLPRRSAPAVPPPAPGVPPTRR